MPFNIRDIRKDVYDYVPKEYHDLREAVALLDVTALESERLHGEIADVLNQFFVDTATWGLANWERVFNIPTDTRKTYAERRAVIKSQMRGAGTTTITLIKDVASAYDGGEVAVTHNSAEYSVTITFIDTRGVPSNLDDIQRALTEIIPAHLAINFEFNFLIYSELATKGGTYADVTSLGLTYAELLTHKYE